MPRPLDRTAYASMDRAELDRRLRECRDRMERADTMEAALADAFTEQELCAAIYGERCSPA